MYLFVLLYMVVVLNSADLTCYQDTVAKVADTLEFFFFSQNLEFN